MPSLSTQPTRLAVPSHAAAPFVSPKVKDTAFAFVAATVFRFYRFLTHSHDKAAMGKLGDKVKLLFEDVSVLQDRINPNAPIESTDLAQAYCGRVKGNAIALIPLSSCGKNLFRTAVVELAFGRAKAKVILSQVLTAGRWVRGYEEPGLCGIRYDPAAEQFTLNTIARALTLSHEAPAGTKPR